MSNVLVVYDSMYGNTERVARAMVDALASEAAAEARRVGEVSPEALASADVLVVGSPTQGFRPTKPVVDLLKRVQGGGLRGVMAAAFDTRLDVASLRSVALRLLVKTGGFAAPRIGKSLVNAGAVLVVPPEGFHVDDTEGPLRPGELDRAASWAKAVLKAGGAKR